VVDVSFLPAAQADYDEAFAWYLERSARAASGFKAAVADGVQQIGDNPETYALIDKRHRRCLLRRYPFSLVYRIETTGVVVVAVAHSRRRSWYWRGRA
jgi:plasmid stabilization system protein ParE